ncbi:MAG TPA: hypothetical protein VEP90_26435, partial [Methylomirabilota bacterium]|nr:hypothetical protein [Methylomirabilota bacterium]
PLAVLPGVTSFEDLLGPSDRFAPPNSIDVSKLTIFNNQQNDLKSMITNTIFRDSTPTVITKK